MIVKVDGNLVVPVPTTLAPGTYDVNITVEETENHTGGMANATLTIEKQDTTLIIGSIDTDVHSYCGNT